MDLSKAFDTINQELSITKLHAYEFSKDALKLFLAICQTVSKDARLINLLVSDLRYFKGCHKDLV